MPNEDIQKIPPAASAVHVPPQENAPVEEAVQELPPRPALPRLIVFGGSFDPIHRGHLELAETVLKLGYGDEVMFIPSRYPPHKTDHELATPAQRWEMLQLVVEGHAGFSCSDIELKREGEMTYTYDTMSILTKVMPDTDLRFLIGMDSLRTLHEWHKATELVIHFNFLIYPRPGYPAPPYAELREYFGGANARKLVDSIIPVDGLPQWDISSSDLRRACRNGGDLQNYLPAAVWKYIQENTLYHD